AIKIKGDTTEFNAAAYTVQPNAKVEDLLKQLPGIQVDKDGKITAQGQTVNKVLVDGEEFFGDDPTLVTKNIRADMVDKVQLYDKKSDQATFTGIDDGQKEKTLNIKLKADKKNGFFGKTEEGAGTDGIYQSQLLFNAFKGKKKFSVYGTMGNNGKTGLGWEDNQKYGSGDGFQFEDDGSVNFGGGGGDDLDSFDGRYYGQGLPLARTAGVHYDNKWNDDKQSINTNYKIGSLTIDGTNDNLTQNNLKDTVLNSTSNQRFHKYMFKQKLDAVYQVKLDTSSNLKISVDGTTKHSENIDSYSSSVVQNVAGDSTLLNKQTRTLTNNVDAKLFNASAFYTKKFKKPGRTISFLVKEAYNESKAKGFLNSRVDKYNAEGEIIPPQLTDQYKTNDLKGSALTTNLTYSEPFSKNFALVLNYGIGINNSSADRQTFLAASGIYNVRDDSLSSDYKLNQFSNHGGAIFNYKKGKTNITFGTRVSDVNYHQVDESGLNPTLDRSFLNWSPQASYQYRFSQQKSFRFNYNGNTTQPTLDQIQPLRSNSDPVNTVIGNPDLKPSFTNNINLGYNSFRILTSQYIWLYGNYSITSNPIVSDINYDKTTGYSVTHYVNLPDKKTSNFNLGANFNRKLESLGMSLGLSMNANGNTYYGYSDGQLGKTKSYSYNPRLEINQYKEKKFDYYLSAGPTYTINQSSLQTINSNGWGFRADGQFNVYLPGKFQIGAENSYEFTGKTETFNQDLRKFLINAYIIKKFLKSENLKFTIWGNDLLNQNVGFSRTATGTQITQSNFTTLKRYIMFSIAYDFTKMGGGAPKK
ncbi:MAG TPA: outer membrane beta-barrel family protein, partial [Mucilaginibacter sp.]|nr:outer membrane beta-barrel family protein [Mucilaginibacter sp.]